MERLRKKKASEMNVRNKLFRVILETASSELYYLYFTQRGFYELRTEPVCGTRSRILYHSRKAKTGLKSYEIWLEGIEPFFETGVDTDSPLFSYKEIALETLITSEYSEWRDFAKKRLLK